MAATNGRRTTIVRAGTTAALPVWSRRASPSGMAATPTSATQNVVQVLRPSTPQQRAATASLVLQISPVYSWRMNQDIRASDLAASGNPFDAADEASAPISFIDDETARDLSDRLAQRYSGLLNLLASR